MAGNYSPLNVFRYCPKCGCDTFAPDTEKSLKCSGCDFRYFINMSAAVAAVIRNEKRELLFTIRKNEPAAGMLDLPGGFVDMGETAENAIRREILEELNLTLTRIDFLATFTNTYIYGEVEYQTLDLVFECEAESLLEMKAADDVSEFVFRNPCEVDPGEIGLESIREIIRTIAEHK